MEKLRQWIAKEEARWLYEMKEELEVGNSHCVAPLGYRWCYASTAIRSIDMIWRTTGWMFWLHMLLMPICPIAWIFTAPNARLHVPDPELIDWSFLNDNIESKHE